MSVKRAGALEAKKLFLLLQVGRDGYRLVLATSILLNMRIELEDCQRFN